MGEPAQGPQSRFIHASDDDLPVGEFQQAGRIAIEHRGDHALRREEDGKPGLAQRVSKRKIVAHGTVPEFHHVALLEAFAANRRTASPAEIPVDARRDTSRRARSMPKPARSRIRRSAGKTSEMWSPRRDWNPPAAPRAARASSGRDARRNPQTRKRRILPWPSEPPREDCSLSLRTRSAVPQSRC